MRLCNSSPVRRSSKVVLGLVLTSLLLALPGRLWAADEERFSSPQASVDALKAAVEGRATNHDKFQHDVFFTATLWDANGKAVGTATGKLEDWPAGHSGIYELVGTSTSRTWTRVSVVVSNVTEHVRGRAED